jgi:hypothetical protein
MLGINVENDMSKFTPDLGMLFYADSTAAYMRQIGSGDTAVELKEKDLRYCDKVLRCVAADDRTVIANVVWGESHGAARRMLLRSEYVFQPLGPGIAQALGLDA